MKIRTRFTCWSTSLFEKLDAIHAFIRQRQLAEATDLYVGCTAIGKEWAGSEVEREREFIELVDKSLEIGSQGSPHGLTPRQSLIYAALTGWRGDDVTDWSAPVERETLLAWAYGYYDGPREHLAFSLDALIAQGLFFEVHPGVFEQSCYFCSYETAFLDELPDGRRYAKRWDGWRTESDESHPGWDRAGLCLGQGSVSSGTIGLCLGSSCCCFGDRHGCCKFGLKFKSAVLTAATPSEPRKRFDLEFSCPKTVHAFVFNALPVISDPNLGRTVTKRRPFNIDI